MYDIVTPRTRDWDHPGRRAYAAEFIAKSVKDETTIGGIGMGFAIVADSDSPFLDYVTVGIWDAENPLLLHLHSRLISTRPHPYLTLIERVGDGQGTPEMLAGRIIGFESEQWQAYLSSQRTEGDKRKYLSACFSSESHRPR